MKKLIMFTIMCVMLSSGPAAMAQNTSNHRLGRLGVGFSNQLLNDIPSLSIKLRKSRKYAFSLLGGINSAETGGGYGFGAKIYNVLIDEPRLNFYGSILGGYILNTRGSAEDLSGFQVDLTLGSEFSFAGIESLAFSLEFGFSLNKLDEFVIETVGHNFIVAAVYFYI